MDVFGWFICIALSLVGLLYSIFTNNRLALFACLCGLVGSTLQIIIRMSPNIIFNIVSSISLLLTVLLLTADIVYSRLK